MRASALPRLVASSLLCLCLACPPARADNAAQYDQAVVEAQANAANPGPWVVNDLKVVTGPGSGDGNTYVDGKLVATTFTKDSYYQSAYPGLAMTVYGSPSTSATWVTIGGELKSYWARLGVTAANVKLETSRALGMSDANTNTAIVEMLVSPTIDTIQRPTRDPSIAGQPASLGTNAPGVRPAGMSEAAYADFTAYYATWMGQAYGASHFPWTQLGYTYRWGYGDSLADIRGLSEFIVLGGRSYTLYAVYSLTSYLYTAGNGSGDFHVTGDLDTLWAGRLFQPRGDSVVIDAGAVVSGGQGLLISSPGYTVTNAGTITGSTAKKYGLDGTEDVAVLFLGRAPVAGSLSAPLSGPGNTLVNTGAIASPGTAVRADAGDTAIVDTGSISGGAYAVRTGDGADSLTVRGGTLSGAVDLGGGDDVMTASGGSSLAFALSPYGTSRPVANVETLRLAGDTSLSLTFDASGYVPAGMRYVIAEAARLDAPETGLAVSSNLPMVRFVSGASGGELSVTALRDTGWYGRLAANRSLGTALDSLTLGVAPGMEGLIGRLDQYGDPVAATAQLSPGPQTRTMVLAVDAASAFTSAFAARLRGVRGGEGGLGLAPAGFAATDAGPADLAQAAGTLGGPGGAGLSPAPWRAALPTGSGSAPATTEEGPLEAFASFYGGHGQGSAGGGAPGYVSDLTGLMAGAGARVSPWLRLGLAGGYAWSRADYQAGKGSGDDHIWRIGPYASLDVSPWSLDVLLTYGAHRAYAERPIPFWGATASSRTTMREALGYLRAGRIVDLGGGLAAEPFVEGQYLLLSRDAVGESGAGAANLLFPATSDASLTSVLGLRLEKVFELGGLRLRPEAWGGWRHEYGSIAPEVRASFEGAPGRSFSTGGGRPDRDQGRLGAALTLGGVGGKALTARCDVTSGAARSDLSLSLGARLTF